MSRTKRPTFEARMEASRLLHENRRMAPHLYAVEDAKLRAYRRKQATPPWADLKRIKEIYKECEMRSVETGVEMHVDHIIPIRGVIRDIAIEFGRDTSSGLWWGSVSGLHVPENLQIIPKERNLEKGRTINLCDMGAEAMESLDCAFAASRFSKWSQLVASI